MTCRFARVALLSLLPFPCTFAFPLVAYAQHGKPPAKIAKQATKKPSPVSDANKPLEISYGFFVENQRIGYLAGTRKRASYKGKTAVVSTLTLRGQMDSVVFAINSIVWKTPDDRTLEDWDDMTVAGQATHTHRLYSAQNVIIETTEPGKPMQRRTLSISAYAREEKAKDAGQENPFSALKIFIPDSWKTDSSEVITVAYQPVKAYRIQQSTAKNKANAPVLWIDKERNLLRIDFMLGETPVRFERMPLKMAMAPLSRETVTATIPSDKPLAAPRTMRVARYQITGLANAPTLSDDDVQAMTVEKTPDGKYTALVSIATGPADSGPVVALADVPRVKFAAFLQPGSLTPAESDDATRLAREIIGGEKNAARAAQRLSRWVYENVSYDWDFGGVRTAAQTLKDRRGVCQNYTTLLITLARAAGIPAKYCAGPTYIDGKYLPHAWAECWVGKWVAFEPTWGVPFADAAHIKLAEGEPDAPLASWDASAPPRITYLAAGEKPISFASQQAEQKSKQNSEIKAAELLAKRIEASAKNAPQSAILTVSGDVPPIGMVTACLPFGTTADYEPPGFAEVISAKGGKSPAIAFTLPDGRKCLLVDTLRGASLTYDQATVRIFEYSTDESKTWIRAIVQGYQPNSDPRQLAKRIQDQIEKEAVIYAIHPASSDKVLPFLAAGSTVLSYTLTNYRTAKGVPLPVSLYKFPTGKQCFVFEVSP